MYRITTLLCFTDYSEEKLNTLTQAYMLIKFHIQYLFDIGYLKHSCVDFILPLAKKKIYMHCYIMFNFCIKRCMYNLSVCLSNNKTNNENKRKPHSHS